MSFRQGLLRARGQIAFLLGLSLALGLVIWMEVQEFRALVAEPVSLERSHPDVRPPAPLSPTEEAAATEALRVLLAAEAGDRRGNVESLHALIAAARLGLLSDAEALDALAERAPATVEGDPLAAARLVLAGAVARLHLPAAAETLGPRLSGLPLDTLTEEGRLRRANDLAPGQAAHAARVLALVGVGAWQDWSYLPLASGLGEAQTDLGEDWLEGLLLNGLAFGPDGFEREAIWRLRRMGVPADLTAALSAAGFFEEPPLSAPQPAPDTVVGVALLLQALAYRALGPVLPPSSAILVPGDAP